MSSKEFIESGILETYVLGLCTPEQEAEVENMRRHYPDVQQAIEVFEKELEQKFLNTATPTTALQDEKVLQLFREESNTSVVPLTVHKPSGFRWYKIAAAAAILLFGASALLNYILYRENKEQKQELASIKNKGDGKTLPAADFSVLTNQKITPVAMYGVGIHSICRCTLFWDKATGKAYVMIHHLVPAPEGKSYQLWASVNGQDVNAGLLNDKIRDRFIEVSSIPGGATGFRLTLESAGGNTTPTLEETYLVGKI